MNILLFSQVRLYYPIHQGGTKRIYNVGKYFQKIGHKVHFVYYADNGIDAKSLKFMLECWDSFTLIEKKKNIPWYPGNNKLDDRYEEHIAERVNEVVEIFDIDIVWCNYMFQAKFFETLPEHIFKIIDAIDAFADRYKLFENDKNINYTWYSYSKEDEMKALNRADLVVAITEQEKKYFTSVLNTEVKTIGHIEESHFLIRNYNTLSKIGFLGGAHEANYLSLNAFLKYFYTNSKIKNDIEIIIAGDVCKHIEDKKNNLLLLGRVNDVAEFYQKVDMVISPIIMGSGQKIKSVEALSYGTPIVSTDEGFKGIESDEPCHLLKTMEKMTVCIESLYDSPEKLRALAAKSKEVFVQYEEEIEAKLTQLFGEIKISKRLEDEAEQKNAIERKNRIIQQLYRQNQQNMFEKMETKEKINQQLQEDNNWITVFICDQNDFTEFTIKPESENVNIAFYLYKDDERVDTQWYSKKFLYRLDKQKYSKGRYRIRYFIVDDQNENPGGGGKKEMGYSQFIEI